VKIYINNQELDFTLENEKTIQDIITSLEKWLNQSQLLIFKLELDGKSYTYDNLKQNKELQIDTIQIMNVEAKHVQEVYLIRLNNLIRYFSELSMVIEKDDYAGIEKVLTEYKLIRSEFSDILKYKITESATSEIGMLDKVFAGTTSGMIQSWTDENKQDALHTLSQVKTKLALLKNEIENPLITLNEIIQKLKDAKQDIIQVSILLQTGKDREAMQAIVNFTELTQSLLKIFSNVQLVKILSNIKFKEKSFAQFYSDFNKNLNELITAFERKDFVLIGDLLEYEIAPSIEEIITISEKIIKQT